MASFGLATEKVLSDFALIRAGLNQARAGMERTLSILFGSFALLGAVSLFGFIFWVFSPFAATCCGSSSSAAVSARVKQLTPST